jgi:hypothetical protein
MGFMMARMAGNLVFPRVLQFLGASAKLQKPTSSFMSIRPSEWNNLVPIEGIFMKHYV